MAIKPWKQVGTEVVLASKSNRGLVVKMFINPQTGKQEDFVQFAHRDFAVVLAITRDGMVLVESEFKQGRNAVDEELPSGAIELNESPEEAARRELLEETGYRAGEMLNLGCGWMNTRNSSARGHYFLATNCYQAGEPKLDENEDIETRLVPLEQWLNMVVYGAITEPGAVLATVRALPYLDYIIVPTT